MYKHKSVTSGNLGESKIFLKYTCSSIYFRYCMTFFQKKNITYTIAIAIASCNRSVFSFKRDRLRNHNPLTLYRLPTYHRTVSFLCKGAIVCKEKRERETNSCQISITEIGSPTMSPLSLSPQLSMSSGPSRPLKVVAV